MDNTLQQDHIINTLWESVTTSSTVEMEKVGIRYIGYDSFKLALKQVYQRAHLNGRAEGLQECTTEVFNMLK